MMHKDQPQINNSPPASRSPLALTALMVAIAVVLGWIAIIVPIVGIIASFLYALPFAVIIYRFDLRWGIMAVLAVTVILAFGINPIAAGLLSLQYAILGLFFGQCFRKHIPPLRILVGGAILSAVLLLGILFISVWLAGLSWDQLYATYEQMAGSMIDAMVESGGLQGISVEEYKSAMMGQFFSIIPAALVIYSMLIAVIEYAILVKLLRRLQHEVPALPPFESWCINWQLVWGLIIAIILNALARSFDWSLLIQITTNVIYIYVPILLVCGLSLFIWMWRRILILPIKVVMIFAIIFLFVYFIYFLMIIAVLEPIFNLRKRLQSMLDKK
jgi:uncharacterized protein YybS (DUF2232 family)